MQTPSRLAGIQASKPNAIVFLFDLRYNADFKNHRMEIERPDIVWFGTSRAGSAMASMFKPYSFYNMAFTGWTTEQLAEEFERSTRIARPKIAIMSVDFFLFSDRWENQLRVSRQMIFDRPWQFMRGSVSVFFQHVLTRSYQFEDYAAKPGDFVGVQANGLQEGFRSDGSWQFSQAHIESASRQNRNASFMMKSFPGSLGLSPRQKGHIARIAEIAKARGIRLVGVQLPYLRAGVDVLDKLPPTDAFYGFWHAFEGEAPRAWLAEIGIEFVNLSHSPIDDDPANFIDAYHLSESGMAKAIDQIRPALKLDSLQRTQP